VILSRLNFILQKYNFFQKYANIFSKNTILFRKYAIKLRIQNIKLAFKYDFWLKKNYKGYKMFNVLFQRWVYGVGRNFLVSVSAS